MVNKKQVNKNKVLKPSSLYKAMLFSAEDTIATYRDLLVAKPKSFEFHLIKEALLHDELIVQNQIQKINHTELELQVTVSKKKPNHHDMICQATFGFQFKKAS